MKTMNKVTVSLVALALCAVVGACGGGTTTPSGGGSGSSGGSAAANGNGNGSTTGSSASLGAISTPTIRADGTVVIGPGFTPTPIIMAGSLGGPTDVTTMGTAASGYCVGMMPTVPQHVIEVTAPMSHLRIVVDTFSPGPGGSNDATLFVRIPGGSIWCDDDGGGELQPMVEGAVMAGRVEIFVGAYSTSGVGGRYKIAFTESHDYTHYSISGGSAPSYDY